MSRSASARSRRGQRRQLARPARSSRTMPAARAPASAAARPRAGCAAGTKWSRAPRPAPARARRPACGSTARCNGAAGGRDRVEVGDAEVDRSRPCSGRARSGRTSARRSPAPRANVGLRGWIEDAETRDDLALGGKEGRSYSGNASDAVRQSSGGRQVVHHPSGQELMRLVGRVPHPFPLPRTDGGSAGTTEPFLHRITRYCAASIRSIPRAFPAKADLVKSQISGRVLPHVVACDGRSGPGVADPARTRPTARRRITRLSHPSRTGHSTWRRRDGSGRSGGFVPPPTTGAAPLGALVHAQRPSRPRTSPGTGRTTSRRYPRPRRRGRRTRRSP